MPNWVRAPGLIAMGMLFAVLALFASQGTVSPALALFADSDGDSVTDVAEISTGSDPSDPHSTPEDVFPDQILSTALCADGVDNDNDGLTDSADDGCSDDDGDFMSNHMESSLGSDGQDEDSVPEDARFDAVLESLGFGFYQTCANSEDDDGDGAVDAADSGCDPMLTDGDAFDDRVEKRFGSDPTDSTSVPEHDLANPGSCSDGIDNDGDGTIDGAEVACRPVTNDSFDSPRVIGAVPYEDAMKITSATPQPGEPNAECVFKPAATVWYKYTASATGSLAIDTAGTNFPNTVAVWIRNGDAFRPVTCASSFAPGPFAPVGARASFQAVAGEAYYVQIAGSIFPDQPADLRVSIDVGHPPANDNFATPRAISSLPFTDSANVADATVEFGEPISRCTGEAYSTVWYRYNAQSDGLLIAQSTGSGYQAGIAAFTDSQFGLTEVACSGYRQRVAFRVDAGRTYYIQVASLAQNVSGQLRFELAVGQSPANDDFAAATNVVSIPFEQTVDASTATTEVGEPRASCSFADNVKTVWYRFQAEQSGFVSASIVGGATDFEPSIIAAYHGTSLTNLTELDCANPYFGQGDAAVFHVTAGDAYYIQAGPFSFEGDVIVPGGAVGGSATSEVITVRIDVLQVPSCAPGQLSFSDPTGDLIAFGAPPEDGVDVTSITGGGDGSNYCLRVDFAQPLPAAPDVPFEEGTRINMVFDTDVSRLTGFGGGLDFPCDGGQGRELSVFIDAPRDVLVQVGLSNPPPIPIAGFPVPEPIYAFVLYGERSLQVVIPMSALGDQRFLVAASVVNQGRVDCVPNGGSILSPAPAALGDANCDGAINSLDSTLILQRFAGLLTGQLPCEYAGDVNQNGSAGPIDAVLILQYNAGMISAF